MYSETVASTLLRGGRRLRCRLRRRLRLRLSLVRFRVWVWVRVRVRVGVRRAIEMVKKRYGYGVKKGLASQPEPSEPCATHLNISTTALVVNMLPASEPPRAPIANPLAKADPRLHVYRQPHVHTAKMR